jgi:N-acetylneuraminic acid mutarotase
MKFALPYAVGLTLAFALAACGDEPTSPDAQPVDSSAQPDLAVGSNSWVTRADMPGAERWNLAVASIPQTNGYSLLYAIGGSTASGAGVSTNQVYNAKTNRWSYRAPLPARRISTNGIGVIKGKLYISGGMLEHRSYQRDLFEYNPATNTWAVKAPLPGYGYDGGTGVINNQLYVLTGCADYDYCDIGGRDHLIAFYRYDPLTNSWTTLPSPPERHGTGVVGTIGGRFYVAGGYGYDFFSNQLHVYDPATNAWTARAPLPKARTNAAGGAMDGKLYVMGGFEWDASGRQKVTSTLVYDPATNTWVTKRSVPAVRDTQGQVGAARVAVNGQSSLEVVGGTRPGNNIAYIP